MVVSSKEELKERASEEQAEAGAGGGMVSRRLGLTRR